MRKFWAPFFLRWSLLFASAQYGNLLIVTLLAPSILRLITFFENSWTPVLLHDEIRGSQGDGSEYTVFLDVTPSVLGNWYQKILRDVPDASNLYSLLCT